MIIIIRMVHNLTKGSRVGVVQLGAFVVPEVPCHCTIFGRVDRYIRVWPGPAAAHVNRRKSSTNQSFFPLQEASCERQGLFYFSF